MKNATIRKQKTQLKMGKRSDPNRHLTKEDIQVVNKYMERCSPSYVIRKLQIKSAHPSEWLIPEIQRTPKILVRIWSSRTCHSLLVGM